jgi:cobalt-zinc-cadmium efflux system membrane fusion protein
MSRSRIGSYLVGALGGILLGAVAMFVWQGYGRQGGESEAAQQEESHEESSHEEHGVTLSAEAIKAAGVEIAEAAGGLLEQTLALPGEIGLNADKTAHIVPRVSGIVRRVDKYLGDAVRPGEVMAVLESRELAESKAAFLAARQRLSLAEANFKSAEELHTRKIMPDLEFLGIRKAQAEAQIDLKTAENRLHALGLSEDDTAGLLEHSDGLALYELRAPFAGTVIAKHCSLGEVLNDAADAFVLADLTTVWANITVYAQDVARVRAGQTAHIRVAGDGAAATGAIAYVAPLLNEATRSALARVDLPNPDRRWRPGMFITAAIVLNSAKVPVLVPLDALQRLKDQTAVFVVVEGRDAGGVTFEPRPVVVGRMGATHVQIVSGLAAGERYAVEGASILKADLAKGDAAHED